jgi:peptidoglycan hydrolase FlgJ
MTLAAIGNLTPQHQTTDADEKSVAEARQVAQQFEAIFLRQLLGALEKTGGQGSQGAAIYKSMMVGALADSASANGGIGLADVIFKAMLPPALASSAAAGSATAGSATAGSATAASKPASGAAPLRGGVRAIVQGGGEQ